MIPAACLTDEEIDTICAGLVQSAAKVRYLTRVLKVPVVRKPNGRPLVKRADWDRSHGQNQRPTTSPKWSTAA